MGDFQFKIPIEIGDNSFFAMTKTRKERIKQNLIFVFSTDLGERVVNSNIGSKFRKLLFENHSIDINKQLEVETNRIFNDYFPELVLNKTRIKVTENSELSSNYLLISIAYSFKNSEDTDTLSLAIG